MQNPPPVQTTKSSTGLDENIAALLSYVFGWVSGLVFFLIEKDSRLVRFHAMQSILLNAVALVVGIVLWFVWVFGTIIFASDFGCAGLVSKPRSGLADIRLLDRHVDRRCLVLDQGVIRSSISNCRSLGISPRSSQCQNKTRTRSIPKTLS